ncbi:NAD-dependent epimerase/dehydratase family protein, partial [Corallococcus sicarius]
MYEALKDDVVLVTGGSGYLGGWTVVSLLKQGYRVRTTLRSLEREGQVRADIARQVDPGDRLSFFAADLLADEGWERAARGAR